MRLKPKPMAQELNAINISRCTWQEDWMSESRKWASRGKMALSVFLKATTRNLIVWTNGEILWTYRYNFASMQLSQTLVAKGFCDAHRKKFLMIFLPYAGSSWKFYVGKLKTRVFITTSIWIWRNRHGNILSRDSRVFAQFPLREGAPADRYAVCCQFDIYLRIFQYSVLFLLS